MKELFLRASVTRKEPFYSPSLFYTLQKERKAENQQGATDVFIENIINLNLYKYVFYNK